MRLDSSRDADNHFLDNSRPLRVSFVSLGCPKNLVDSEQMLGTLADERGKGLGAHASSEPLRMAHNLGYRVGVLQSSPMGHGLYKRLGFADFGGLPLYIRSPA